MAWDRPDQFYLVRDFGARRYYLVVGTGPGQLKDEIESQFVSHDSQAN
jgi:hypothetical protein